MIDDARNHEREDGKKHVWIQEKEVRITAEICIVRFLEVFILRQII
jgi:hypothetical protein